MIAALAALTYVQAVLLVAVLSGLLYRSRLHLTWSFGLYLLAVIIYDVLAVASPETFRTWEVWAILEATHALLKVAMGLELSSLIFKAFPGARRLGRLGLWLILTATVVSIVMVWPTSTGKWIRDGLPRAQYGAAYVFSWLLAVVLWYRIPLHPLHKAILTALVPYLLFFTVGLEVMKWLDWQVGDWGAVANVLAFIGVLAVWVRAAWRRDEQTDVAPDVAKAVQPWA